MTLDQAAIVRRLLALKARSDDLAKVRDGECERAVWETEGARLLEFQAEMERLRDHLRALRLDA
jgi:hypothetical protein